MRFSVIIPCFNAARTIERALDSLSNQSFDDWEAICVDDCSNDNTIAVIKAYQEHNGSKRIILLCNEKNSGPGVSRNNGISVARGEYICFLDSDDYYDLSTFRILDEVIQEKNPDIVLYGCNQIIGNTVRKRPVIPRNSIPDYLALIGGSFCGGIWRNSLWNSIDIPAISNAEDIAVIPVLISRASSVSVTNHSLYNYIHSNSSTSSHHTPQVSRNFVASFHYTLQHLDINRFFESIEFHGIKTVIYGATLNALKAGMTKNEVFDLWSEFEQHFPYWKHNPYLKSYALSKRLFVWLAAHRYFTLMRCYAIAHSTLLNTLG